MSDVFKALADPTRRKILLMLVEKPRSVNEISEHFKMSRPAISKHLKILNAADLMTYQDHEKDARKRLCCAELSAMEELTAYLNKLEEYWKGRVGSLDYYLSKQKNENEK